MNPVRSAALVVTLVLASAATAHAQSWGELQRYCNMGRETPYSVRDTCARYGLGGWGSGPQRYRERVPQAYDYGYGGYGYVEPRRAPPPREYRDSLPYLCSLGRETPYSVRPLCHRYGYW